MAETVTFHFAGGMADDHKMNFYEAARFQYAAARLMVKLAQFRSRGGFVQKLTNTSNFNVQLTSQSDGSFNINVEEPAQEVDQDAFMKISLAALIAFVSERVIEKLDDAEIYSAVEAGSRRLSIAADGPLQDHELDSVIQRMAEDEHILESLPIKTQESVRRRLSEINRQETLAEEEFPLSKIDFVREQKLISMSAPLLSEMATALRRSADTLEILSKKRGESRSIMYLDQKMAREIETASVDKQITPLLGDIEQYNKYNGWGKLKIENGTKTLGFNIPSDIRSRLQEQLIERMKEDMVYLQTYFVRDRAGEVSRLIVVGILPTPLA